MRRSGTGSGGGLGMNKNVRPPVRTGRCSQSTRPAGVAQIGAIQGNYITNKGMSPYRGDRCTTNPISSRPSSATRSR